MRNLLIMRTNNVILLNAIWMRRAVDPATARQKIRGHVVQDVRCAGHGPNAREARTGALGEVPGVRTELGCYVGKVEA